MPYVASRYFFIPRIMMNWEQFTKSFIMLSRSPTFRGRSFNMVLWIVTILAITEFQGKVRVRKNEGNPSLGPTL